MQKANICQDNFSSCAALVNTRNSLSQGPAVDETDARQKTIQTYHTRGREYPMLLIGTFKIHKRIRHNAPDHGVSARHCTGKQSHPPLLNKAAHGAPPSPVSATPYCTTPSASAPLDTSSGEKKQLVDKIKTDTVKTVCKYFYFLSNCLLCCLKKSRGDAGQTAGDTGVRYPYCKFA